MFVAAGRRGRRITPDSRSRLRGYLRAVALRLRGFYHDERLGRYADTAVSTNMLTSAS